MTLGYASLCPGEETVGITPQESFFGHMKDELQPYVNTWDCFQDVKERIDDYITYYNNDRYQTTLGGMSPNEYYHYVVTGEKPSALVV